MQLGEIIYQLPAGLPLMRRCACNDIVLLFAQVGEAGEHEG